MTKLDFYLKYIKNILPKFCNFVIRKRTKNNELYLILNKEYLFDIAYILKYSTFFQMKSLNDICVVDYPSRFKRFELIYNFISIRYNFRFFVKSYLASNNYVHSLVPLFKSSNWIERECWDMYGVFFLNHPDLRRILTDYGFEGFPLKKDFPLTGYVEVRYDDEKSNIVYEPVEMAQEYRLFNFTSPWEKIK